MIKVIQLSIIIQVFSLSTATFDAPFARNYMYPIASAAFSSSPQLCLNDLFPDNQFQRLISVGCDDIRSESCAAFTTLSMTNKSIIISFRGSADDFQVIEEAGSIFKNQDPFIAGGKVNSYFYNAYSKLWKAGIKDDFLKLKNSNPTFELWVTGHSLGAAMASLCAAEIIKLGYIPESQVKLITFGQPRTGDKDYAIAHDSLISYSYRVVHAHDIVPHLPTEGFENYQHHKIEIWFNNAMLTSESGYTECDEDESNSCSDGSIDLSIEDHRSYYGKDIMTWANLGCKY